MQTLINRANTLNDESRAARRAYHELVGRLGGMAPETQAALRALNAKASDWCRAHDAAHKAGAVRVEGDPEFHVQAPAA